MGKERVNMKEKKKYEKPEMKMIIIELKDVISTSVEGGIELENSGSGDILDLETVEW